MVRFGGGRVSGCTVRRPSSSSLRGPGDPEWLRPTRRGRSPVRPARRMPWFFAASGRGQRGAASARGVLPCDRFPAVGRERGDDEGVRGGCGTARLHGTEPGGGVPRGADSEGDPSADGRRKLPEARPTGRAGSWPGRGRVDVWIRCRLPAPSGSRARLVRSGTAFYRVFPGISPSRPSRHRWKRSRRFGRSSTTSAPGWSSTFRPPTRPPSRWLPHASTSHPRSRGWSASGWPGKRCGSWWR